MTSGLAYPCGEIIRGEQQPYPGGRRRVPMDLLRRQLPEYEEDKRKRLGEEGAKPKRIRYKPISR
jgi:hypothetical protein